MRSEQDMLDLIVGIARQDKRIRAVVMNGSRANPNAPRDRFQDFDVVYFVTDVAPFKHNYEWIKRFGEMMILQMPEDMQDPPPNQNDGFAYLMQFTDGNRIDLGIDPLTLIHEIVADSQSLVLLDKDGCIPPLPPASDRDYLPKPPTAKAFADCCNEFWWVSAYVAKGLWRKEILYAKHFLDHFVRDQLMKMLNWYIGLRTQFSGNPGKYGKYVQRYLDPEHWALLQTTYSDAGYENTWDALFATCALFRHMALEVAGHFCFDYAHEDDRRVSAHLDHMRNLPRDAKEIYHAMEEWVITQVAVDSLSPQERAEIIQLCTAAYEESFADLFDQLPDTIHLLARFHGELVSHAAWVTRWLEPENRPVLKTAYVEAVATAPQHQGKGYASAVLRELAKRIAAYDVGALSPSEAGFYARLGWELWRGPLGIRTEHGVQATPGEQVMILRLEKTPPLDLDRGLTAEWRRADLW